MRLPPSPADADGRPAGSGRPLSGRGLALLAGPLLGLLVAQVVDRSGPGPLLAAVAVFVAGGVLLTLARRLHLTLLPVTLALPLAGYLTVVWPEQGFTLVFDLAVVGPFLLLCLRKLARPDAVRLVDRRWWPIWAFVIVALLQFVNPDGVSWLVNAQGLRRNVLPMLLFFVAANVDLSVGSRIRRTAWLSMAVGAIVAAWGLKQHFLGLDAAERVYAAGVGTLWLWGASDLRIFSTLRVPWALAAYIATIGLLSVSIAVTARTWTARVLAWAMALLFGVVLVFTFMRGVMVGCLIGTVVLAATGLGRRRRFAVPAVMLLAVVVALGVASVRSLSSALHDSDDVVVQRFLTLMTPLSDEAVLDRFFAWERGWDIVVAHPLGLGLGTTSGVSARYEDLLSAGSIHTDNLYLGAFVETGWVGGVLLLLVTVWIFVRGRHAVHRRTGADAWLAAGILAGLVTSTVASLATPVVWEPGPSQLYWMMAGALVNLAEGCPCDRRRVRGRSPSGRPPRA